MIDRDRFMSHVALEDDGPDACWIWVGAMSDDGRYGRYWQNGEMRAHWAAWEIQHGAPVPPNSRLTPECRLPFCVRHWKLVGPARKVTAKAIRDFLTSGLSARALGRKYGVTHWAVLYHRARHRNGSPMEHSRGSV